MLVHRAELDVLNALSMMDNALFLEDQKFNRGDGILDYYLTNYKMKLVAGGMDENDDLDSERLSGVGVTML